MDEKKKKIILNIFGWMFIILGIIAFINGLIRWGYEHVLWLSYFGLLIIGIGTLKRSSFLIMSQLNFLTIPYIIWDIDFFYVFFSGKSLFGLTDYIFNNFVLSNLITLQHLFTVPLGFYLVYLIKIKRKDSWKLSCVYLTFMFFISQIFSSVESNINCVYRSCLKGIGIGYYPILWFVILFGLVFLTMFIVNKIGILHSN